MSHAQDVCLHDYAGPVLAGQLLDGRQVLRLDTFGPRRSGAALDDGLPLDIGRIVHPEPDRPAVVLGSGTVTPAFAAGTAVVPLGSPRTAVLLLDGGGGLVFLYPDGAPDLPGATRLIAEVRRLPHAFAAGVMCFARDTMIRTAGGDMPVQMLRPGMAVQTRDAGLQRIAWIGTRTLGPARLHAEPDRRPILIRRDALGPGIPARDLVVSPQHRLLVGSRIARRMFDEPEVLVAAQHLTSIPGVGPAPWQGGVTYLHFVCEEHQLVLAEGACAETLHTSPDALKTLSETARREVLALFPDLGLMTGAADGPTRPAARRMLNGAEGRQLARRHAVNQVMTQG
ncbi:Hint domain-containing protein [Paracoccus sp. S4493]|uniref:Hint domain-containing protein n=1 Tax=Paracoccus sp. S4493 TaxID=579490 RepID=UPI000695E925|nr:Hint domain-containing protein [Paracoccus sp. S4493]